MHTHAISAAVVMQRLPVNNRWISHQWRPLEVILDGILPESGAHCLRQDENDLRWMFSGFDVTLFSDEAEGYFLNIDSPNPCWFIMWRMEQIDGNEVAVPKLLTLSYNEAARLMDGGEQVETLPVDGTIREWLAGFVADFYKPEQKRKRMKPSFEGGAGVEKMAQAEGDSRGS